MDAEKAIGRNPHPDFNKVQASREPFDKDLQVSKTSQIPYMYLLTSGL